MTLIPIMDYQKVLSGLSQGAKEWAENLRPNQLVSLLEQFYEIETQKVTDLERKLLEKPVQVIVQAPTPEPEQFAVNIGKFGEQTFEETTKTLPINYNIINTAKAGYAGDFIIEYSTNGRVYKCLVDIKTYRTTVPKKEIDKFIADMTYGNYDGGLLVSNKSNFVGHPESVCIEDLTLPYAKVPVMYIAKLTGDLINSCIEVICAKMATLVEVQMDQSTIMTSINFINTSLSQSASTRRMLSEMQRSMATSIQTCQENLIGGEVQIKMALKQMKREIDRPSIKLMPVPKHTSRNDNIQDSPVSITPDLPIVGGEEETDDTTSEEGDFVYRRFCSKDRPLIQQVIDMEWSSISQDDKGLEATFECPFINMDLKPLKTKTRVEIFDEDNSGIDVPEEILELMTRKPKKYIGSLTQEMIDVLHKYFSNS